MKKTGEPIEHTLDGGERCRRVHAVKRRQEVVAAVRARQMQVVMIELSCTTRTK